eukprot:2480637-Pleurochrysis_carterae.AAC.1
MERDARHAPSCHDSNDDAVGHVRGELTPTKILSRYIPRGNVTLDRTAQACNAAACEQTRACEQWKWASKPSQVNACLANQPMPCRQMIRSLDPSAE